MEGELWELLYRIIVEEHNRKGRKKRVQYSDAVILLVYFWSVLHDRPRCWACQTRNWTIQYGCLDLPSASTLSRRMKSLSVIGLLTQVFARLCALTPPGLLHVLDGKPLVVGPCSKDRDAKRGRAHDVMARGYRLLASWGDGRHVVPEAWTIASMNTSEPRLAQSQLLPMIRGVGYAPADALFDDNVLYDRAGERQLQLLAPRRRPHTGLGHCYHSPFRLRAIAMLEDQADDFGRRLYALRPQIERDFAHLVSFGGGLASLPAWVRRPRRVALFVAAKLIINGLRLCQIKGLAA
jgi:hypothetical protein